VATGEKIVVSGELKVAKLTDQDDIEASLATFERIMEAYEVPKACWAYKLATNYDEVKSAILRRYNIIKEMYGQRLRGACRKEGETYWELAMPLLDLVKKWTRRCSSVEELCELVVSEQLINLLPQDIQIWVQERKPTTSSKVERLADDYFQACRHPQPVMGVGFIGYQGVIASVTTVEK